MKKHVKRLLLAFTLSCLVTTNISAEQQLLIVGESFPPYKFEENGKIIGIDIDVARYVFTKIGVDFKFQICPWKRCWRMLQVGAADVGLAVSKKKKRWSHVHYPLNSVWDSSFYFFTHKSTKAKYDIKSFDDVKRQNLMVGIVNGNSYHEAFWEAFPYQDADKEEYHHQLEEVTTAEMNLKKLEGKRIDVYPIAKTIGLYLARKKLGLKNITYYDFVLFSKSYPNVFSMKSAYQSDKYPSILAVMQAYDKELGEFKKTPEFQAIFSKYE